MALTRGRNFQDQQTSALPVIGNAALATNEVIMSAIDSHLDNPLRLSATQPSADRRLQIAANVVTSGDGTSKAASPADDTVPTYVATAINFFDGTTSGGTITVEGSAFALPTLTGVNKFVRMVMMWQSGNNRIDCKFSDEAASQGALDDPGEILTSLDGTPVGYIDLESIDNADEFRTAGSVISVIENLGIFRFTASGGGGGSLEDFKLKSISSGVALVGRGRWALETGFTLISGGGTLSTTTNVDLNINLDTVFGSTPADATTYELYIDLFAIESSPFELTDTKEEVLRVVDETSFKILTLRPDEVSKQRYVHVGTIVSATTGNSWDAAGSSFTTSGTRVFPMTASFFASNEEDNFVMTTATETTFPFVNLSAKPQAILILYFDGTDEIGVNMATHLVKVSDTEITINSETLTFGGGEELRIGCTHLPITQKNIASSSHQFVSSWFQNDSVTTLAHTLSDMDDIKDYAVQEWDVTADKRRTLNKTELVLNFDDDNFYLDWGGLTPTATLQFRVVAGGSPLPNSVPLIFGGYNKFVGTGPGSYDTITAAVAAAAPGDSILVAKSYSIAAAETVAASDIKITFMPGVQITVTAGNTHLSLDGDRIHVIAPNYEVAFAGSPVQCIRIAGNECEVVRARVDINDAGCTLADAYVVDGDRNYVNGLVVATAGDLTNAITDNGTNNDFSVRG